MRRAQLHPSRSSFATSSPSNLWVSPSTAFIPVLCNVYFLHGPEPRYFIRMVCLLLPVTHSGGPLCN